MSATHPRIKLLPDHLINQIAAGEVVERPASVVKELLDNTLDAGANEIVIEIEQGGIGLIRIRDNGCGIQQEDLALAITRHATSKIRSLSDLQSIMTLGFRGEALPSIGSISRMSVTSKFGNEDLAWTIKAEGRTGQSVPEPVSHPSGTTIEVRDLFFNTPARRKYLRTERTELYQIQQLVRHFAIAHPQMAIKLSHNGKSILNLKPDTERDNASRVEAIYGKKFIQNAVTVEQSQQELHLHGWLGLSDAARTINDSQFFCLNGRCIRDKRINHAVTQAYQDILPAGRYPAYALYLSMDPTQVDVNVHPAKTEVRFRDGRNIHDFIYSAMHQTIHRAIHKTLQGSTQPTMAYSDQLARVAKLTDKSANKRGQISPRPTQNSIRESVSFYQSVKQSSGQLSARELRENAQVRSVIDRSRGENASLSGQIGHVFLIRREEELILVDALALRCLFLHERLTMDNLKESPPLLFPISFEQGKHIQGKHIQVLLQHKNILQKLGFDFHHTGEGLIQLRRVPIRFADENEINMLLTAMAERLELRSSEPENALISSLAEQQVGSMATQDIESMLDAIDPVRQSGIVKKLSAADLLQIIQER